MGIGDGVGMREVGHYVFSDSDTWSFKTNRIAADGSFYGYGYGNDLTRGFDVYRFSGAGLSVPALEPEDLAPGKAKKEKAPRGKPNQHAAVGLELLALPLVLAASAAARKRRQR